MKVSLDKEDLVALVKSVKPHHDEEENPQITKAGKMIGIKWTWTHLYNLSKKELWEIYNICKNSWKNF